MTMKKSDSKKSTPEKKKKQITLFFTTREKCATACEKMALSTRKITDLDKKYGGNYSKMTGHYVLIPEKGVASSLIRENVRAKLIVNLEDFLGLDDSFRTELDICDRTSIGRIVE